MKNNSFEKKIDELNDIVERLENGNASLEESISLYEKGMKLSAECMKILNEAKQKVEFIKNENYIEVDFDNE